MEAQNKEILEKTLEQKNFEDRLSRVPNGAREKYSRILLDEQLRRAKINNHRPVSIPLEEREDYLELAKSDRSLDEIKMIIKMERDWKAATSKKGRPPIGGAQDD